MAGLLERVAADLSADTRFKDPDTYVDAEGRTIRERGIDAPETIKVGLDGTVTDYGTAGGAQTAEELQALARAKGFDQTQITGEAAYDRAEGHLVDGKGDKWNEYVVRHGLLNPVVQSTDDQLSAYAYGKVFRTKLDKQDPEAARARANIDEAMASEGYDPLKLKELAVDERTVQQYMQMEADKKYAELIEKGYGRNQAHDEAQMYGRRKAGEKFSLTGTQIKGKDRDIFNRAYDPISESGQTGLMSVAEAGFGAAALLGDTLDLDVVQDWGNEGVFRMRERIGRQATPLLDWKDVNDFSDGIDYLGSNLAMSLPYMGAIVAGSFLGPAGMAGVGSLYAGQVYNEQPEDNKNVAMAWAGGALQAALDRAGLDIILKKGPPKEMFNSALKELTAKGAGQMGEQEAKNFLMQATRRELAEMSGDASRLARQQLKQRKVVMDTLADAARGTAGEGVTESIQELIAYTAANTEGHFDWNDVGDRMIDAAIAGGTLGGAFGTAGTLIEKGKWADIAFKTDTASTDHESLASKLYKEEARLEGGEDNVLTADQIADETRAKAADMQDRNVELGTPTDKAYTEGMQAYEDMDKATRKEMTFTDKLVDTAASFPALLKGHLNWAFKPEHLTKYRSIRKLEGMLGGKLQKTFSGETYENFKHNTVSKYKNMVPDAKKFYKAVGAKSLKDRAKFGKEAYEKMQGAIQNGRFNPDLIPNDYKHKALVVKLVRDMQRMGDAMHADQSAFNPDLGYIDDYLLKYKAFDKSYIENNQSLFIDKLTQIKFGKKGKMSRADATAITDAILHNDQVDSLDQAFSVVKGTPVPGSHKKRSLGLSERKEFQQFMQQDIFANMDAAAKAASRYQAHEKYIGKNGRNIVQLLEEARMEGMPDAEVNKLGKQLKDYLDAESGNYKRPTTAQGKSLIKMQKNFIVFTTLTSLASATVSSLPELAMMFKGLSKEDVNGIQKQAAKLARELNKTMDAEAGSKSELDKLYDSMKQENSYGYDRLRDTGLLSWDVGAATTTGVTEVSKNKQVWLETFFKYNGLSAYTDMTRAIRASFAGDFIFNHLNTIMNHPENVPDTNEVQEAREQLRNIGLDISPQSRKRLLELMSKDPSMLTPEEELELGNKLRTATYNFVNDAIALPTAGNRPLFYSDPRFALFTQFQGFIATITANHIPKLWNEYIKRGSPQMKYNAFALMVTMVALGFVSQHLKDLLKYGGSTPHLDQAEYIRRGVESSGLLGTPQRITDTLFPMYAQRSENLPEWAWGQVTAQSPALSKGTDAVVAGGKAITGDTAGAAKDFGRLTAIPGKVRDIALGGWDFNGGQ